MEFSQEQLKKVSEAKSVDEIISIAKTEGINLTKIQAEIYFKGMHTEKEGEISDDELKNVAGGTCYSTGVTDPYNHEWRQYAIVSPMNFCDQGLGPCMNCRYSFRDGATWYCSSRWKTPDGEKWRWDN